MATTPSLPLSQIFPVSVVLQPTGVAAPTFNQGLIVGPTAVIPTVGASLPLRVRSYPSTSAMLQDGFTDTDPEYLAAELYFAQPVQPSLVWIGRQNLTAIQTAIPHSGSAGTGYVVGDQVTVVQPGATGGVLEVSAVGVGGSVTTLTTLLGQQGDSYTTGTALTTTGGTGTGLEVDITAIGETAAESVEACRIAQTAWYCCVFVGTAVDADHEAIALFIEGASPKSTYMLTSGETNVLNNVANNLFATLQAAKYNRTLSVYSTTQGGAAPNNIYAAAAVMGRAMGLNTGGPGSYWQLAYNPITGVIPEPLTIDQALVISGSSDRSSLGLNGNIYVNYQNGAYTLLQFGVVASGQFYDTIINTDMIAANMQIYGMNLLYSSRSVTLTDVGVQAMVSVLSQALNLSKQIGFIAPSGTWTGPNIGTGKGAITTGSPVQHGYLIYVPPVSTLSATQRANRQFPPFTAIVLEAGSLIGIQVTVDVQP